MALAVSRFFEKRKKTKNICHFSSDKKHWKRNLVNSSNSRISSKQAHFDKLNAPHLEITLPLSNLLIVNSQLVNVLQANCCQHQYQQWLELLTKMLLPCFFLLLVLQFQVHFSERQKLIHRELAKPFLF